MIDLSLLQQKFATWLQGNFSLRCYSCRRPLSRNSLRSDDGYYCGSPDHDPVHITIGIYNRILANQQRTGMMEELGELSHVDLKEEQAIREYSPEALVNYPNKATEDRKDAIGDLLIYTINYCNIHGLDLEEILNTVGSKVLKRDWNADREAGGEKVSGPSE